MIWDHMCAGAVEISSAELSHTGRYSCTARNAAGSTHRHVQLTVQGKNTTPSFEYFVHFYFSFIQFTPSKQFDKESVLSCCICRLLPYMQCCLFLFDLRAPSDRVSSVRPGCDPE